ncbi:NAD(P)-dependent alcohol dehydrogenase [Leucobacter chromiireducens]|uniref:NAD(P)-dependent alcohol dehydrogenase n=1 Tax=Leucobacter chromiireducens TaxID=283877 RepID=UPI003F7FFE6C
MTIPSTMQAYRIPAWGEPARFMEVEVPTPGAGEVLVQVAGAGLCHSDFGMQQMPAEYGAALGWQMPFTLGHETGGTVAAIGSGVTKVEVGQAVALVSPSSCGACEFCLTGHDNNCPFGASGRGYGRDGGLAPYVLVDSERALIPLDTLDPATVGPLTDAGNTAMHAVKRVLPKLGAGSSAVVIGAGGLGAFAIQIIRALSGATVIAVDTNPQRLEIALELGAHHTLTGVSDTTVSEIQALTGGIGANAILDFAGFDATIAAGLAATRPGGSYGLVGAGGGKLDAQWFGALPRDGEVFAFQGGTIADTHDVISLAESGAIRNDVDTYPFERVAEAYEDLHAGRLRGRAVILL